MGVRQPPIPCPTEGCLVTSCMLLYRHFSKTYCRKHGPPPVRGRRDERHQIFHGNVWPLQPDGFACRILEDEAVGLQIPILLQQADPVFSPVASHGHQLFTEIPTVKQEDTKRE